MFEELKVFYSKFYSKNLLTNNLKSSREIKVKGLLQKEFTNFIRSSTKFPLFRLLLDLQQLVTNSTGRYMSRPVYNTRFPLASFKGRSFSFTMIIYPFQE